MAIRNSKLSGSIETVYALLADYGRYAEWAVDVAQSEILDQEGDIAIVEFTSPELLPDKYVLELIHSPPNSILYQQVDQFEGQGLRGSWQLSEAPEGVLLTGEMQLNLGFWHSLRGSGKVDLILRRRLESLQRKLANDPGPQWFVLTP